MSPEVRDSRAIVLLRGIKLMRKDCVCGRALPSSLLPTLIHEAGPEIRSAVLSISIECECGRRLRVSSLQDDSENRGG